MSVTETRTCDGCPEVFTPKRPEQRYHDLDCSRRAIARGNRKLICTKCGDIRTRKKGKRRPNALVCMTCERERDRRRRKRRTPNPT